MLCFAMAHLDIERNAAVRELAKVHRRVPWWEIRARIALVDACADW